MAKTIKLTVFLMVFFGKICCQNPDDTQTKYLGCLSGFDVLINHYSDSLNLLFTSNKLPVFLDDYLLDWKMKNHLQSCLKEDEGISIRKFIIDRVVNKDVLKLIISSPNKNLDKCYNPDSLKVEMSKTSYVTFPILPFMHDSFRTLARNRLNEIEKKLLISRNGNR